MPLDAVKILQQDVAVINGRLESIENSQEEATKERTCLRGKLDEVIHEGGELATVVGEINDHLKADKIAREVREELYDKRIAKEDRSRLRTYRVLSILAAFTSLGVALFFGLRAVL
jgi:hypothetical protein